MYFKNHPLIFKFSRLKFGYLEVNKQRMRSHVANKLYNGKDSTGTNIIWHDLIHWSKQIVVM